MNNQIYLVIGSGISGIAASNLLESQGAKVLLYDGNEKMTIEELQGKLPPENRVECYVATIPEEIKRKITQVIISPGVPIDIPIVKELQQQGARILGEVELAFLIEKGRVAAITGTNGKTTTTALVGAILKAHFGEDKAFIVGNIGNPYTKEVVKTCEDTVTVGEMSSFQLETIHTFRPDVSAILNITPDHLDRHYTMEAYVAAKERIAINQRNQDICVLNYNNPYTRDFGSRCPARVIYFSTCEELEEGYFLKGNIICRKKYLQSQKITEELLDIHKDMKLVGLCNVENVMAAIAVSESMGVPMETIREAIRVFPPVEHRIEWVGTKGGVDYYNDSKATNTDAAIQGIQAMNKPTLLIAGGFDKGSEYESWVKEFEGRVKWLLLIGQTRDKIAECARNCGFTDIRIADTFQEALKLATDLAEEGDAVLLSPACASWDMFKNYEARGVQFKEYVYSLKD